MLKLTVTPTQPVTLGSWEILTVVQYYLSHLSNGYYIRDNDLWHVEDMQGHGSDIHQKVSSVDDPNYAEQVTALRMLQLVKNKCPNRLEGDHRMQPFRPGERCLDCGTFKAVP